MNGETFIGIVTAGFGSSMSFVSSTLHLGQLSMLFLALAGLGIVAICDDIFNDNRLVTKLFGKTIEKHKS
ncbi:hypothetical protein MUP05_01440 [Candidatus Bathyarchaeota archaeon]|nr:hypothetical protein [Candidatus Bathyarchaeota archaeon]